MGALGVFLVGMKLMSEALQKVAGARLKSLLATMTSNRISGVLTGLAVTGVVQSSSATTVMVVGFVSAELFTLTQAIGVIMGANIGTTFTGWVVALLGFKIKIAAFALPMVAAGVALTLTKGARKRQWGEVAIGFGVLFLGLGLMKEAVPTVGNPEQFAWIQSLTGGGFLSTLAFVGVGTALTVLLQSSSATMTLTITLAAIGWLPYPLAAAMILGENIGTTATANLAAIGAPVAAKRAARVHLIFNLVGVAWALALMNILLLPVVDSLVPGDPNASLAALTTQSESAAAAAVVATHLAAMHSLFNVTNTLLMLPLVPQLESLVRRWVPEGTGAAPAEDGTRFLETPYLATPELSLIQASKSMHRITDVVREMFRDAIFVLTHPDEELDSLAEQTLTREQDVDQLEREVVSYLTRVASAATSAAAAHKIAELMQNVHRLERIGDHCTVLVRIARRIHQGGNSLSNDSIKGLDSLAKLVDRSLENVGLYLAGDSTPETAEDIEDEIDMTRRRLRARHIQQMEDDGRDLKAGLAFLDALTHLEEIGDRAVGIIRQAENTQSA